MDEKVFDDPVIFYLLMTRRYLSLKRRTLGFIRFEDGKLKTHSYCNIDDEIEFFYKYAFINDKEYTTEEEYEKELKMLKKYMNFENEHFYWIRQNHIRNIFNDLIQRNNRLNQTI